MESYDDKKFQYDALICYYSARVYILSLFLSVISHWIIFFPASYFENSLKFGLLWFFTDGCIVIMVFQTAALFIRSRGPDEFWRKRKIFKLAAHFYGRKRNCYSIAIRYVHRALQFATKGRKLKKEDMANLWDTRVAAGCEQHGLAYPLLREGLARSNILLNRKVLADLAIWEPYSFKALTQVAWAKMKEDKDPEAKDIRETPPSNVITRGLLD